jgi:hypothetical protein
LVKEDLYKDVVANAMEPRMATTRPSTSQGGINSGYDKNNLSSAKKYFDLLGKSAE